MFFLGVINNNADFFDYANLTPNYYIEVSERSDLPQLTYVNVNIDVIFNFMVLKEYKIPEKLDSNLIKVNISDEAKTFFIFTEYKLPKEIVAIQGISFKPLNFYFKIKHTIPNIESLATNIHFYELPEYKLPEVVDIKKLTAVSIPVIDVQLYKTKEYKIPEKIATIQGVSFKPLNFYFKIKHTIPNIKNLTANIHFYELPEYKIPEIVDIKKLTAISTPIIDVQLYKTKEYKIPEIVDIKKLTAISTPIIDVQLYKTKEYKIPEKIVAIQGISFKPLNSYFKIKHTIPEIKNPKSDIEQYLSIPILKVNYFIDTIVKIITKESKFFSRATRRINKIIYPQTSMPYRGVKNYRGKYY